MRFTLVGPVYPYRGGIAHYTTSLAKAIQVGHTLQLISFKRQYPAWLYPGQSDRDPSSERLEVQAEYILDPVNPFSWRSTCREIEAYAPQRVVLQWWTTYWAPAFGYLARRLTSLGIPVVYLIHNVLPHEVRPWDRWLARLALKPANSFIVQTSRENDRLQTLLPGRTSVLCPHPVYDLFTSQHIPQGEARSRLRIPADKRVILFFGIVRPYKGLHDLLEAMSLLGDNTGRVHLLVAGEIWGDPSIYQRQIENLGLKDRVTIDNRYIPNEEVPLFFSAVDLFAAPYTAGTASGATKLALGFGLPAVVTRNIVDDTLQHHTEQDVFVSEPNNPADLSRTIQRALSLIETSRIKKVSDTRTGWTEMVAAIVTAPGDPITGQQVKPSEETS
jgi:glycosyltransferase involved in cell wall biosynthesis